MNVEDIKKMLEDEQLKQINLNLKFPSRKLKNTIIINKFLKNFLNFNKSEIIYLLLHKNELKNLHIFCPTCGKKNVFNNIKHGYSYYCCAKHSQNANRNSARATWIRNYGVDNPNKCRAVREKVENTSLKNCGYKCNFASPDPKLNGRATYKEQTGYDNPSKNPKVIKKILDKIRLHNNGVLYVQTSEYKNKFQNKEWINKRQQRLYESKKKNGTLKSSNIEERCYNKLLIKFLKVEHSYRDNKRYPFVCDFYIPELDLFIEGHFGWRHGCEPFDKNNHKHIEKLNLWKLKAEEINFKGQKKKSYLNAIYQWTDLDVRKLKTFIDNKLNYKIFYTEKEFDKWLKTI